MYNDINLVFMERKECTCLTHEYFTISGRNLPRALVYLLLQQVLTHVYLISIPVMRYFSHSRRKCKLLHTNCLPFLEEIDHGHSFTYWCNKFKHMFTCYQFLLWDILLILGENVYCLQFSQYIFLLNFCIYTSLKRFWIEACFWYLTVLP